MSGETPPLEIIGVTEGEEIVAGSSEFTRMKPLSGLVLEACLQGSSIILASGEEWFALGILEAAGTVDTGWRIVGSFLGCENEAVALEVGQILEEGFVHICADEPCPTQVEDPHIHVTRVRLWRPSKFKCTYLRRGGATLLKQMIADEKARIPKEIKKAPVAGRRRATRGPPRGDGKGKGSATPRSNGSGDKGTGEEEPIQIHSEGEEGDAEDVETAGLTKAGRAALRESLKQTRERILGGGAAKKRKPQGEDLSGGIGQRQSGGAAAASALVAGTALNPKKQTPLRIAQLEDTNDAGVNVLTRRASGVKNASTALLAQAAQQSALDAEERKRKRRQKDKKDGVKQLIALLQGKKKSARKSSSRNKTRKKRERSRVKPDPDGSDPSDSSGGGSGSSYSGSQDGEKDSGEDSDLSMEPPLRKKAAKEPGSVLAMLIRHAQEQLDRGALLECQGDRAGVTSGIKLSTYFALLIRPYYQANSPLLRELYALAQSIDLLRMGRLPETGDALASRFIAVHTAMTEGNWQAASQLEIFPLEPVQSATTATMLEAHKHRRLVLKSQGYPTPSRWWQPGGKGKGFPQQDKGKKGDGRGRGKGKGKSQGKETNNWGGKGDASQWRDTKEDPPKKT
eukprot:s81_g7.t1